MARVDPQPAAQPEHEPTTQTQIQLSEMPQPNEPPSQNYIHLPEMPQPDDHSQVQILNNFESQTSHTPIHQVQVLAIVSLTVRIATWLCLLVSLIILASNTSSIKGLYMNVKIQFSDIYTYRYMMSAIVIGFAYTCVQVPLEVYQLAMAKSLTTGNWLAKIIFYGDKVLLSLLATGVGAAFGATFDLKKNLDQLDDFLESIGQTLITRIRSKLDDFFNMTYVSAGFLLIAFLCALASSILSSLALQKK